jgi:tRNA pseudouridine55 synthase
MNKPNAPILSTISEGILLVDKPRGKTSFSLVSALRRLTHIQKIGHAGTLDPFATGLMIMLVGKNFTRLSQDYLCQDKEYECKMLLGISTDSYDCDGKIMATSSHIPTLVAI